MLRHLGRGSRRCSALTLSALVLLAAARATAQTAPVDAQTRALQLLREAEQLSASGNASEACDKYRESASLDAQLDALLPWARCLEQSGKLASAYAAYGDAVEVARRNGDPRVSGAEQAATALRPRVSFLTIDVPASHRLSGLSVERDGFRLGSSGWGVPMPIDAGVHEVVVRAFGYRDFLLRLEVKGEAEQPYFEVPHLEKVDSAAAPGTAALPVASAPPAAVPAASPPPPVAAPAPLPVAARSSGLGTRRTIALAAGGAAVVGLALGTYFLIKTDNTLDERDGICPTSNNCEPGTNLRLAGLTSEARSQQRAEVVFFALAGASAALAAGLWFWPGPEASDHHTYVAPALSPQAAGLVLGGQL
jgi:hypothetical protein